MLRSLNELVIINHVKFWVSTLIFISASGLSLLSCSLLPQFTTSPNSTNPVQTPSPVLANFNSDLGSIVTELEKTMPHADTEGFIIPSKTDQETIKNIVYAIENNTPDLFRGSPSAYNYEILKVSDQSDSDAESYVLHERLPITKGWGLYVFRIRSAQNIIIEAPHPLADKNTPKIALDLYRALQARALLISGTHRNANKDGSADSAHAPVSIFQTIHETLFQLPKYSDNPAIFIQVHGFAADSHPNYPQVVIGHNWKDDPEKDKLLQKIVTALKQQHIKVGACNGENFLDLCGTENIQSSIMDGGIFIHMELDETIRNDDTLLVSCLKQALSQ